MSMSQMKSQVRSRRMKKKKHFRVLKFVYVGDFTNFRTCDSSLQLINHSNCLISSCFLATLFIEPIDLLGHSLRFNSSALSLQTFLIPKPALNYWKRFFDCAFFSSCTIHDRISEDSRRSSSQTQ